MQKITQVGVLSMGKVMGGAGFILGAVFGILYGVIFGIAGAVGGLSGELGGGAMPLVAVALGSCIGLPILYGALSFVMGLLYGVVLNFVFKQLGGLEIRIENEGN